MGSTFRATVDKNHQSITPTEHYYLPQMDNSKHHLNRYKSHQVYNNPTGFFDKNTRKATTPTIFDNCNSTARARVGMLQNYR